MKNYNDIKMMAEGDSVRFALTKKGERMLYVFGVNPSTATDTQSDPTMRKVIEFASKNGFDGFVMMNIYPLRSTNPDALPQNINMDLHHKNLQKIQEIMGKTTNPVILLSFGNSIDVVPYLKGCLYDIVNILQPLNPEWKQIGTPTKKGNPRHPSRSAYSLGFQDFDIKEYLKLQNLTRGIFLSN